MSAPVASVDEILAWVPGGFMSTLEREGFEQGSAWEQCQGTIEGFLPGVSECYICKYKIRGIINQMSMGQSFNAQRTNTTSQQNEPDGTQCEHIIAAFLLALLIGLSTSQFRNTFDALFTREFYRQRVVPQNIRYDATHTYQDNDSDYNKYKSDFKEWQEKLWKFIMGHSHSVCNQKKNLNSIFDIKRNTDNGYWYVADIDRNYIAKFFQEITTPDNSYGKYFLQHVQRAAVGNIKGRFPWPKSDKMSDWQRKVMENSGIPNDMMRDYFSVLKLKQQMAAAPTGGGKGPKKKLSKNEILSKISTRTTPWKKKKPGLIDLIQFIKDKSVKIMKKSGAETVRTAATMASELVQTLEQKKTQINLLMDESHERSYSLMAIVVFYNIMLSNIESDKQIDQNKPSRKPYVIKVGQTLCDLVTHAGKKFQYNPTDIKFDINEAQNESVLTTLANIAKNKKSSGGGYHRKEQHGGCDNAEAKAVAWMDTEWSQYSRELDTWIVNRFDDRDIYIKLLDDYNQLCPQDDDRIIQLAEERVVCSPNKGPNLDLYHYPNGERCTAQFFGLDSKSYELKKYSLYYKILKIRQHYFSSFGNEWPNNEMKGFNIRFSGPSLIIYLFDPMISKQIRFLLYGIIDSLRLDDQGQNKIESFGNEIASLLIGNFYAEKGLGLNINLSERYELLSYLMRSGDIYMEIFKNQIGCTWIVAEEQWQIIKAQLHGVLDAFFFKNLQMIELLPINIQFLYNGSKKIYRILEAIKGQELPLPPELDIDDMKTKLLSVINGYVLLKLNMLYGKEDVVVGVNEEGDPITEPNPLQNVRDPTPTPDIDRFQDMINNICESIINFEMHGGLVAHDIGLLYRTIFYFHNVSSSDSLFTRHTHAGAPQGFWQQSEINGLLEKQMQFIENCLLYKEVEFSPTLINNIKILHRFNKLSIDDQILRGTPGRQLDVLEKEMYDDVLNSLITFTHELNNDYPIYADDSGKDFQDIVWWGDEQMFSAVKSVLDIDIRNILSNIGIFHMSRGEGRDVLNGKESYNAFIISGIQNGLFEQIPEGQINIVVNYRQSYNLTFSYDKLINEAFEYAHYLLNIFADFGGQGGGAPRCMPCSPNKFNKSKKQQEKTIINYLKTNKSSIKSLKDKNRKLKKTYRKKLNKKYKIINKSKRINRIKTKRINRIKTKRINKRNKKEIKNS